MAIEADAADEERPAPFYDGRLARRLLAYAWPFRGLIAAALLLLLVDGALQLVGPWLTRWVIDRAVPARDTAGIAAAATGFFGVLVAQFAAGWGETQLTTRLGQRIMHRLRTQLFAHVQRLPVPVLDRQPVGRLVTRVTADVEALNELFTAGVVAGLGDLFTLLAISVLMLVLDWRLALAAFAVIPAVVAVSQRFRREVRVSYRAIRARLARINALLQERLSGVRVVQLFGREPEEEARFAALNAGHLEAHLRSVTVYALYFPAIEVLTTVALAAILVAGARRLDLGAVTVGTVAAFLQLVRRFFEPLQDLSDKFNTLQQAMAASERIFALLDEPVPPAVPAPAPDVEARLVPPVAIAFEHVWFAYDAAAAGAAEPRWVLRDVSFEVPAGGSLAIVGHTGAGKTTIISLLLRFHEAQRGRILVNGVDHRTIPVDRLRQLIGYVQQDIFLFAGDIASNIRLSAPRTDAEVAWAAAQVGADRVVAALPGGYAYALGERGASISVGERQLLSFARAIAADPAVLVLDEATSAVDSEREGDIQRALQVLMRGRTTVAIAHRLSTIRDADEILVLHHGQVHERGTHRALLARQDLYARLWRLQDGARPPAA